MAKKGKTQRYPKSDGTVRPIRLWNATENEVYRWRCYTYVNNAHDAALLECRKSKVGTVIHVYNARTGNTVNGDYTDFEYKRNVKDMTVPKLRGV